MKRKNLVNGIALAFSVIFIRFLDVRIYDMPIVVSILLLVGLIFGLMNIIDRFPLLEAPVSRRTALLTNTIVILIIFLSFFVLEL